MNICTPPVSIARRARRAPDATDLRQIVLSTAIIQCRFNTAWAELTEPPRRGYERWRRPASSSAGQIGSGGLEYHPSRRASGSRCSTSSQLRAALDRAQAGALRPAYRVTMTYGSAPRHRPTAPTTIAGVHHRSQDLLVGNRRRPARALLLRPGAASTWASRSTREYEDALAELATTTPPARQAASSDPNRPRPARPKPSRRRSLALAQVAVRSGHDRNLPCSRRRPDRARAPAAARPRQPDGPNITVFTREVAAPGGEDRPYLVFLQGGPGNEATRPTAPPSGWMKRALQDYRVLLLDQRGTGRSTPVGRQLPGATPRSRPST